MGHLVLQIKDAQGLSDTLFLNDNSSVKIKSISYSQGGVN